jgi:hypothetical protein
MRPANESTLRARARKLSYCIHKSRLRSINEEISANKRSSGGQQESRSR